MSLPPKFPGTGLEDLVPGQSYLQDALTSCTDPLKAIETFQVSHNYITVINHLNLFDFFHSSLTA